MRNTIGDAALANISQLFSKILRSIQDKSSLLGIF